MSKFIRTCMKCNENFYSSSEYKAHMNDAHSKLVPESQIKDARTIDQTLGKKSSMDVPESILVKPKKIEEKKPTQAQTRMRRAPATATVSDSEASVDAKPTKPVKKRTPRKKRKYTRKQAPKPVENKE